MQTLVLNCSPGRAADVCDMKVVLERSPDNVAIDEAGTRPQTIIPAPFSLPLSGVSIVKARDLIMRMTTCCVVIKEVPFSTATHANR